MLVTWVPQKGVHHDDGGHNQASVCWEDRLPPTHPILLLVPSLLIVLMFLLPMLSAPFVLLSSGMRVLFWRSSREAGRRARC